MFEYCSVERKRRFFRIFILNWYSVLLNQNFPEHANYCVTCLFRSDLSARFKTIEPDWGAIQMTKIITIKEDFQGIQQSLIKHLQAVCPANRFNMVLYWVQMWAFYPLLSWRVVRAKDPSWRRRSSRFPWSAFLSSKISASTRLTG